MLIVAMVLKPGAPKFDQALQHGAPLESLRHALSGRETGPLGAALGLLEEGEQ